MGTRQFVECSGNFMEIKGGEEEIWPPEIYENDLENVKVIHVTPPME